MVENNILNNLISFCEGEMTPEQWISWWKENDVQLKKQLSSLWYLKIKPKLSQGNSGATLISGNNCKEYLKSVGISFSEEKNDDEIKSKWINEIESIKIGTNDIFDRDFKELKIKYPCLFEAVKNNFVIGNEIKKEYNKIILSDRPIFQYLPENVIDFFSCVSLLKMEGVYFDVDNLRKLEHNYIKIGELWLNNDGDEILLKNEETVFYKNISTNKTILLENSFYNFMENNVSDYINKN